MKRYNLTSGKVASNLNSLKEVLNEILEITKGISVVIIENDLEKITQKVKLREDLIKIALNSDLIRDRNFGIEIINLFDEIKNLNTKNMEFLKEWKNRISVSLISAFKAKDLIKYHYSYKMKEKFQ